MLDLRQSEKYGHFMEKIGWKVAEYKVLSIKYKAYVRKLPFLPFSIIKVQRPTIISPATFNQLDKLAKIHHALFIKLEPQQHNNKTMKQPTRITTQSVAGGLNNHGFHLDRSPLLPTKTLQINLTQPLDIIFNQFSKDTRYEIRKAEKNRLVMNYYQTNCHSERSEESHNHSSQITRSFVNTQDDTTIDDFISLWHQNAWVRGFWIPIKKQIKNLWESFEKDAHLVTAYDNILRAIPTKSEESRSSLDGSRLCSNNKLIAGTMIIISNKVAYYFYAASTPGGRDLSAPSLVVWEAIKLAKEKGCTIFDFEGIYDERFPNKSWLGFTHFKKSFGGQEIEYPGCFVKYYNPLLRLLNT